MPRLRILVTGATGYIGGRLVPRLLEAGHAVRCFVRDPERLRGRAWEGDFEIVRGDALDAATVAPALEGIDVAYYLIHSLAAGEGRFTERDRRAADHFGQACRDAGVDRIIYLGGLEPAGERRSTHLESRLETGRHLRQWGVPVTEFRAAVIVGSGSLSFEMIRYLTERVPVMVCPRWVRTRVQPIAVRDVLGYLVEALDVPESRGRILEIGGADVLTYEDMFRIYARVRGLRRTILDVPVLTPRLSSHWVGLVTPINNRIARPLIAGLDNEVVVRDDAARRLFSVRPIGYEQAVRLALQRFARHDVETIWHGAFSSSASGERPTEQLEDREGLIQERRRVVVRTTAGRAFDVVRRLGGDTGWLFADVLWEVRGLLDQLVGGVGLRRGRRSPSDVRVGDAIDFWRVEALEDERLLRLRAEMKIPGRAWLEFRVGPAAEGEQAPEEGVAITQTAYFEPKGLFGLLYWYALYPVHRVIFRGMVRELGRRAAADPVPTG